MARLLGRGENRLDVPAPGSGDGRRHDALDERRVGELDPRGQVTGLAEQRPDGEDGAAQVGQDHDAGPAVGELYRPLHLRRARAEPPVVGAAGGDNVTVPPLIWAASSAAPSARAVLCET